jgi:hypothetical protein
MGNFLGEINRFQRLSGAINLEYDDNLQSSPIGFDLHLGSLPALQVIIKKTQKRYGYNGNSFVCAVEFGPKIKKQNHCLVEVTVAIQNQNTLTIKQPCIEKEI